MARGLNKVMIMGNLGAEPETRYMPSGGAVTNIRVATTDVWKDRQTGEKQEKTEWHRIVFFNQLADIAAKYLHKGSRVFVEGSLRTNKWQDQNGNDRYTTEIIANNMQMMDAKGSGGATDAAGFDETDMPPAEASAEKSSKAKATATTLDEEFDDDIPF